MNKTRSHAPNFTGSSPFGVTVASASRNRPIQIGQFLIPNYLIVFQSKKNLLVLAQKSRHKNFFMTDNETNYICFFNFDRNIPSRIMRLNSIEKRITIINTPIKLTNI